MAAVRLEPLPPAEAVRHFESKGYQVGFAWQDVWQQEHARAFTVAKAMRLDILQDVRTAVDAAIRNGTTFAQFQKELTPILQQKGWWGRQMMTDPLTGEERLVQLGSPRRLRTIFDVNMRTSYAAGRWERIQRVKARRPWLRYSAVLDSRTRPQHRAWHGTVLAVDDPWWETHSPPNGWSCRCNVQQLSDRDLKRFGFTPSTPPPVETRPWTNRRTGETIQVPRGIDPGFGYNVGEAHMRALTPPPMTGPLPAPAIGDAASASTLPPPLPVPASRLLPSGLAEQEYLERFLAEFGAAPGRTVVFRDVLGEPVVIGEQMFVDAKGRLKVTKRGRETGLLLLADTIKQPDEIWWRWEEHPKGRMTLLRRYLRRFAVAGADRLGFALFDVGESGWRGVTGFTPEREAYILGQRLGTLAYRRPT